MLDFATLREPRLGLSLASWTAPGSSAPPPRASNSSDESYARPARRWLLDPFDAISLEQLNAKAAMLERLDNKYLVREDVLERAVDDLSKHFDILENEGMRDFTYETWYFDDAERRSYLDHHQGRRKRCKVRVRRYTDARLCFVEVKLKDKRGITIKKRLHYELDKYGMLDENALAHIQSSYRDLYGEEFRRELRPVVEMRYQRTTLVAKQGGERMTIDRSLVFAGVERSCSIDDSMFVVETKSANANGIADKILRRLHQHPTKRCSKYCIATATLEEVAKHNKFLPALRKLCAIPGSRRSAGALIEHSPAVPRDLGYALLAA